MSQSKTGTGKAAVKRAASTSRTVAKSILLFGSYAPSLITFRGALIAQMVERGHSVIAAAPDITEQIAQELRGLGAQVLEVPMNRTGTNPLGDLDLLRRLTVVLGKLKPDVFIPYTAKPVIWGCMAARRAGVPLIAPMITGLGFAFAPPASWKQKMMQQAVMALYRKALTGAHQIFFQNGDDVATFRARALLPVDLHLTMVNGSGVDVDAFSPCALPEGPLRFLMIARLLKAKGVREYAEAAMKVKQAHEAVEFALVGWIDEGPDAISKGELDSWIAGGIEYQGVLDDVRPALASASVYVLPSYREGTPRSVLEAMAMGRAILTTDVPGCRETVLEGENGFMVPARDADALAKAMLRFIEAPDLAVSMGAASRVIAEDKYDVHKVNQTILAALGL